MKRTQSPYAGLTAQQQKDIRAAAKIKKAVQKKHANKSETFQNKIILNILQKRGLYREWGIL